MSAAVLDRPRMIADIPTHVQMAIRLRAVKESVSTGDIIAKAVEHLYAQEIAEATAVLSEKSAHPPKRKRVSA